MATKNCGIRKCSYSAIWVRNCKAYDGDKCVISMTGQGFCFWHYSDLLLDKLHVKDFWAVYPSKHGSCVVRAI